MCLYSKYTLRSVHAVKLKGSCRTIWVKGMYSISQNRCLIVKHSMIPNNLNALHDDTIAQNKRFCDTHEGFKQHGFCEDRIYKRFISVTYKMTFSFCLARDSCPAILHTFHGALAVSDRHVRFVPLDY